MANLTIQRVAESAELCREMSRIYKEGSTGGAMESAIEAFRELPEAFNALKASINEANRAIKEHLKSYDEFSRTFGKSLGLGIAGVIRATGYAPHAFDDDAAFARAVTDIGREREPLAKLKACGKLCGEIAERVKDWESKEHKLQLRERGDGASDAEIKVIAKKLLAVRDTIAIMRQRGETVTTMFYEAKRAVEAEVSKISDNFTPIFTTGKENA